MQIPFFKKNSSEHFVMISFFTILLVLRVLFIFYWGREVWKNTSPYGISGQNDSIALQFIAGQTRIMPDVWGLYYLPLGMLYKLFSILGLIQFRLPILAVINSVLGVYAVFIFYKITKKVYKENSKFQFLLTATFSLYYPAIYYNLINIPENFLIPILITVFYLVITLNDKKKLFALALLIGFGLILKPIISPLIIFLPLWLKIIHKLKLISAKFGLFIFCILFITGMGAFINARFDKNHAFKISGNGGANIDLAWCQPKSLFYTSPEGNGFGFYPIAYQNHKFVSQVSEVSFDNDFYYLRQGWSCLISKPWLMITNLSHIKNIFSSEFYPNELNNPTHRLLIASWKYLTIPLLIALLYFPILFKRKKMFFWTGILFLSSLFLSVYIANPGEERYIVPFYFIIILFGEPVIIVLMSKMKNYLKYFGKWELKSKKTAFILFLNLIGIALIYFFLFKFLLPDFNSPEKNSQDIINAYYNSASWLIYNMSSYNHSFLYQINADTQKVSNQNDVTRQLIGSHGLVLATKRFRNIELQKATNLNFGYLKSRVKNQSNFSYVYEGDQSTINSSSIAILTLIDSPQIFSQMDLIRRLGKFVLNMQKPDGSFYFVFPKSAYTSEANLADYQKLGLGEATLACINLYKLTGDSAYLNCARKSYDYYSPLIKQQFELPFAGWNIIAYSQIYQVTNDSKYKQTVNDLADQLIRQQIQDKLNPDVGSFDKQSIWATSGDAVFTEALGYAYRINKGSSQIADKFYQANLLGLTHLLNLQVVSSNPVTNGGIQSTSQLKEIMVDNVGHSMSAFEEFLSRD